MTIEAQKRPIRTVVLLVCLVLVFLVTCSLGVTLAISGDSMFAGKRPTNLGVQSGKLASCPGTPNCVNSQSQDAQHQIKPLTYTSSEAQAIATLKEVIQSLDRTQIITENESYLYAEFTSQLMGFVDDVEFWLDKNAKVIQVRSASRLGRSDLGVNRKRIETIRQKFKELQG